MLFLVKSLLYITITVANGDEDDVTTEEPLGLLGTGDPRAAYGSLLGTSGTLAWPQGANVVPLPTLFGGNYLLTDGVGDKYGIGSWSINAGPGGVPGVLTVASYLTTNSDPAVPDNIQDFSLGPGSWDTGSLPVYDTSGSEYYTYPRIRWVPLNLTDLM